MGPVKFGDIQKTAKEVLDDDYHTSAYQFKNKMKTNWNGAVVTTAVDLDPGAGKTGGATPAKVTWKFPDVFGVKGFAVDKLEMDKKGGIKLEASADKGLHSVDGLKVEAKSDLSTATLHATYSGISDTLVVCEVPPMDINKSKLELTRLVGPLTLGVKLAGLDKLTSPSMGVRYAAGPFFAAALAEKSKEKYITKLHGAYKVNDALSVATLYDISKGPEACQLGVNYKASDTVGVKAKVDRQTFSGTLKYTLAKGFTIFSGAKVDFASATPSYGLNVNIE